MKNKKLSYKELQKHYEEAVGYWAEQNEKILDLHNAFEVLWEETPSWVGEKCFTELRNLRWKMKSINELKKQIEKIKSEDKGRSR